MKKVSVIDIANNISDNIIEVGIRPGEELSENLISEEELQYTDVRGQYILIFNKMYNSSKKLSKALNSENAEKMKNEELVLLIDNVKKELENKHLYY